MSQRKAKGQALAEFALIIVVLLLLVFIIIETSRILWGWVTVQNAAREGARYATTGRDDCAAVPDRLGCVISRTHDILSALPLNEDPNRLFEDDNYYLIEVYGVDQNNQLIANFPGAAGKPVIVRVYYRVPIITPLLRPIRESLMVFGQVTLTNEAFNSLGGDSAGVGVPPPIPPLPTPGVTPSPTATPTTGASPTATGTSTITVTPSPTRCDTRFEDNLIQGDTWADVTGDVGGNVILYDLSVAGTPPAIGTAVIDGPFGGHDCPGFVRIAPVAPPLSGGHVILVSNNSDGSEDTAIVLTAPPSPTPSPTGTATATFAPTGTPTPTPSATPATPFIIVFPSCQAGPGINITIEGHNWTNASLPITLFWVPQGQSGQVITTIPAGHAPSFTFSWSNPNVPQGSHLVRAVSGTTIKEAPLTVPCPNITPTATIFPPTSTPNPADLIIGRPELLSTPPIVEYRPLQFRVSITNTGTIEVNNQFFTDLFLDPPDSAIYSDTISLLYSGGYRAVSSLAGGASRVLTISVPLGFSGGLTVTRTVYGVVDSILQIDESNEFNNISIPPLYVPNVTPAPSPTPSPTPDGIDRISGVVRSFIFNWVPQFRAQVFLVSGGNVLAYTETNSNGYYEFNGVAVGTYEVYACLDVDTETHVGSRTGIAPPNPFADIFMLSDPAGCPYAP